MISSADTGAARGRSGRGGRNDADPGQFLRLGLRNHLDGARVERHLAHRAFATGLQFLFHRLHRLLGLLELPHELFTAPLQGLGALLSGGGSPIGGLDDLVVLLLSITDETVGLDPGGPSLFLGRLAGLAHESMGLLLCFGDDGQRLVLATIANIDHLSSHILEDGGGFLPDR